MSSSNPPSSPSSPPSTPASIASSTSSRRRRGRPGAGAAVAAAAATDDNVSDAASVASTSTTATRKSTRSSTIKSTTSAKEYPSTPATPFSALTPRPTSDLSSPLMYPTSSSPPSSPSQRSHVRQSYSTGVLFSEPSSFQGIVRQGSEPGSSQSNQVSLTPSQEPVLTRSVIWGTTIVVADVWDMYKDFLLHFRENNDVGEPYYIRLLQQMSITESYVFNLNCHHLHAYPNGATLFKLLVKYPTEMIAILNVVLEDLYKEKFIHDDQPVPQFQARPYNLDGTVNMRELNPGDIDKLVSIRGIVIRSSGIIPDLKVGFFKCLMCDQTETVKTNRSRVDEPIRCPRCQQERSMTLVHNRCKFTDKQIVRLQETPDTIPAGQTPHTVSLVAVDDLVDVPRPGDRAEVTGIYRAMPVRIHGHQRTVRSIYKTFIEVVHYKLTDSKRLKTQNLDGADYELPVDHAELQNVERAQLEERIKNLARNPNIYEILTRSFAPSIWEMDHVKKGILCQLFGGRNKTMNDGSAKFRGEINILLCGDPGTSKSQMLQYVHKIAPRGIYTSGKGSSAVGLTAYVSRDPETRQYVLESGALVLSDGGICCIDEFDKMSDTTRAVLHEVMEQQTVSVAKAGIICTLNARTSILASANPIDSRWNINRPILENIDLPPTLVSRFDLIYLILDKPNEVGDRRLAQHIVQMYQEGSMVHVGEILDIETLTAYISYAKEHVNPMLTDEAATLLIDGYVAMRRGGAGKKTVTATPRQLESLIRISEALARLRLSPEVEKADVEEAIRLMKEALQTSAIDPNTGLIDMDLITTGLSSASRSRAVVVAKELRTMLNNMNVSSIRFNRLLAQYNEEHEPSVTPIVLFDALTELQEDNFILIKGGGDFKSNPTIQKTGVSAV